ncbi:MAG: hypothetical protein MRY59_01060, partial [Aquisalinus sp.]|nr:hypothetical protein [Aquisalinus sp.]
PGKQPRISKITHLALRHKNTRDYAQAQIGWTLPDIERNNIHLHHFQAEQASTVTNTGQAKASVTMFLYV